MALQDLTPNLRTRLNRVEHVVGIFVLLAALLLVGGFCYYVYYTAEKKGWLEVKAPFFCYVDSASGLAEGQSIKMMGFDVGEITHITAESPGSGYNVYVEFIIRSNYIGYMWTDSKVRLGAGDLLGNRSLEVLKGNWQGGWTNSDGTTVQSIYKVENNGIASVITNRSPGKWLYLPYGEENPPYYMDILEDPALTERASSIVGMAESAMPNILALTNQVQKVLDTANVAFSNLNGRFLEFEPILTNLNSVVAGFKPTATNISIITGNLTNANGGLGQWMLPTNLNHETAMTLASVRHTLTNAQHALISVSDALAIMDTAVGNTDTNLAELMFKVGVSLESVAGITSNLNHQVNSNTNILSEISSIIRNTDEFIQGIKKHWLLRSSFKGEKKSILKPIPRKGPPTRR
jgi:hypothetical protein